MNLKTYLSENKLEPEDFAEQVGVSVFGVRKWISGERIPRPQLLHKIQVVTNGEVTLKDFLEAA